MRPTAARKLAAAWFSLMVIAPNAKRYAALAGGSASTE
jgi:hypothetical protein